MRNSLETRDTSSSLGTYAKPLKKKNEIIYSNNHNLSEFKTQSKSGKLKVDCLVRGEHQATKGKRPLTTEDQGTQAMTIIIMVLIFLYSRGSQWSHSGRRLMKSLTHLPSFDLLSDSV